jgi:hypothetical protein
VDYMGHAGKRLLELVDRSAEEVRTSVAGVRLRVTVICTGRTRVMAQGGHHQDNPLVEAGAVLASGYIGQLAA